MKNTLLLVIFLIATQMALYPQMKNRVDIYQETTGGTLLEISSDQAVYENLQAGSSYVSIAEENNVNIVPWDHSEVFIPATITISGDPFSDVLVTFSLPTQLIAFYSGEGYVSLTYANSSGFNEDKNEFFNPQVPYKLTIPASGEATIRLGGNPSVSLNAADIEYGGNGIVTTQYTGGVKVVTQAIISQQQAVFEYRVTVTPRATLDLDATSVEYANLRAGIDYLTVAYDDSSNNNISPQIQNEIFTPATLIITGIPNSEVMVSFSLPSMLSAINLDQGFLGMTYNDSSAAWVDKNTNTIIFFNPTNVSTWELDSNGIARLRLGGNPHPDTNVTHDEYGGSGLASVEYVSIPYSANNVQTHRITNSIEVYYSATIDTSVVGVSEQNSLPDRFKVHQNFPNPFNPVTVINYQLPVSSRVTLTVYNLLGEKVKTLVDEIQDAGFKSVELDASTMSSGMYLYRLQAGNYIETKKLILLK